jgi:hypothetical protein
MKNMIILYKMLKKVIYENYINIIVFSGFYGLLPKINKNQEIINSYYKEHYNLNKEYIEDTGGEMYDIYKLEEYNGYKVRNAGLITLEKKDKLNNDIYYYKMNYLLQLPLHVEVINKLDLKLNKTKDSFIYISFLDNEDQNNEDVIFNLLLELTFRKGINLVYLYSTAIYEINNSEDKNYYTELLIEMDKKELYIFELYLKENKINNISIITENVNEFFNREILFKKYDLNRYKFSHLGHNFIVYNNVYKKLEDFYIIGDHIMKCRERENFRTNTLESAISYEIYTKHGIIFDISKEKYKRYYLEDKYLIKK